MERERSDKAIPKTQQQANKTDFARKYFSMTPL